MIKMGGVLAQEMPINSRFEGTQVEVNGEDGGQEDIPVLCGT